MIPATSASIESVCTISSNIVTKNRTLVLSRTCRQLVFLKSNELWNLATPYQELLEKRIGEEQVKMKKNMELMVSLPFWVKGRQGDDSKLRLLSNPI